MSQCVSEVWNEAAELLGAVAIRCRLPAWNRGRNTRLHTPNFQTGAIIIMSIESGLKESGITHLNSIAQQPNLKLTYTRGRPSPVAKHEVTRFATSQLQSERERKKALRESFKVVECVVSPFVCQSRGAQDRYSLIRRNFEMIILIHGFCGSYWYAAQRQSRPFQVFCHIMSF